MPKAYTPDVDWAVCEVKNRLAERTRAINYDEGNHPLGFATDKFRRKFGDLFRELADNMCDDVVDEPADRIQITGWEGKDGAVGVLEKWWESHQGASLSGSATRRAFQQGDAYAIVWDDNDGEPVLFVQDPRQMAVRYSASRPGQIDLAAKLWYVKDPETNRGLYRLNLYYTEGRIEHYATKGVDSSGGQKGIPDAGAFTPFTGTDPETGETIPPVEYHDHGQPVFHFPNGETGQNGRSALHQIYPLQDALNKSVADMIVAGEAHAIQNRWATGIDIPTDPVTGEPVRSFKDTDSLWWVKNKEAMFGAFPVQELTGHLNEQANWRREIARKGGLNPATVNGGEVGGQSAGVASGLALLVQEGKTIKRCKDRCRDWGVVWSMLASYVLRWYGLTVEPGEVRPTWAPVETRDDKGKAEEVTLKVGLGLPEEQGLKELGYTEEQIAVEFPKMREEEAARAMDRQQAAQAAMGGGRISPPGNLPDAPVQPNGAAQPVPAGAGT